MGGASSFPRGVSAFGNRRLMLVAEDPDNPRTYVYGMTLGGGDGKTQVLVADKCGLLELDDKYFLALPSPANGEAIARVHDKYKHMCHEHWEVPFQSDTPPLAYGTFVRVRDVLVNQHDEPPGFNDTMKKCIGNIGVVAGVSKGGFPCVFHSETEKWYSYQLAWLEPVADDQVSVEERTRFTEYLAFFDDVRRELAEPETKPASTSTTKSSTSLESKIDALSAKLDVLLRKLDQ